MMIQTVRDRTRDLLEQLGMRIGGETDTEFICRCPFHKGGMEKRASCYVSSTKPCYFCFSCGKGGSLVQLVMGMKKCGYGRAAEILDMVGEFKYAPRTESEPVEPTEIPEYVLDMHGRMAPWGGYSVGFLRAWDCFPGKQVIFFGIRNIWGKLIGVVGRSRGYKIDKALAGRKKDLIWGLDRLSSKKSKTVILVEGPKDYLWLRKLKYPNVLCCFGNGVTREKASLLVESGIGRVVWFGDNDQGGLDGYINVRKRLKRFVQVVPCLRYRWADKTSPHDLSPRQVQEMLVSCGVKVNKKGKE